MANYPLNGLAAPTAQLLSALPRGRRFNYDELRVIAGRLGASMSSVSQRNKALVAKGLVVQHCIRDERDQPIGFEWEVRS